MDAIVKHPKTRKELEKDRAKFVKDRDIKKNTKEVKEDILD